MAVSSSRRGSRYYCEQCDYECQYLSKYNRHLASYSHQIFVDTEVDTPLDSSLPLEDHTLDQNTDEHESAVFEDDGGLDATECAFMPDDQAMFEEDTEDLLDNIESIWEAIDENDDFSPFKSKCHALLYFLFNSPRPLGESNLKFVCFILRQLCQNAPSFSEIKRFELPGLTDCQLVHSSSGIPFYVNNMMDSIRMFLSNPNKAILLKRHPERATTEYSNLFHGRRYHADYAAPMFVHSIGSVFLNDFVTVNLPDSGPTCTKVVEIFLKEEESITWITVDVILTLDQLWQLYPDISGLYLDDTMHFICETREVPVSVIACYCDIPKELLKVNLKNRSLSSLATNEYLHYTCSHNLKGKYRRLPIIILPITLFSDDSSGNKSKKWNKFDSFSFVLASLPKEENAKFENIHFICTSNEVNVIDMIPEIANQLKSLELGFEAFDVVLMSKVVVFAQLLCILADNPRHSEMLNHLGGKAKKYCRMCMADKDNPSIGVDILRCKETTIQQIELIKNQPSNNMKIQVRKSYGIKETSNPLFQLQVDVFKLVPVETLHTILLGCCKYLLKSFMSNTSTNTKSEILARVSAFNQSAFSVKMCGNVCYHHQSFVGRDYKGWMQMCLFIIWSYLSSNEKPVWLLMSKVFKIVYCLPFQPEKSSEYRSVLQSFVESVSLVYPEHAKKVKFHLLLHLTDNMLDFGHSSCFNTERFESFNSLIRNQNIYGNKHSPSRDIAHRFAIIRHLRWICSGCKSTEKSSSAGEGLKKLFATEYIQRFFNSVPSKELHQDRCIYTPGVLRLKKSKAVKLLDIVCSLVDKHITLKEVMRENGFYFPADMSSDTLVQEYGAVVSSKRQLLKNGTFVQFDNKCYLLIACFQVGENSFMALQRMSLLQGQKNDFDCALYSLQTYVSISAIVPTLIPASMIHHCDSTCHFSVTLCDRLIERQTVQQTKQVFIHNLGNKIYAHNDFALI